MPVTLHHIERTPRPRPTAYYAWRDGVLTTAHGTSARFEPAAGLAPVLAFLAHGDEEKQTLYIVTETTAASAPPREWYERPAGAGWRVSLRYENPAHRVAIYRAEGCEITVRHTAAWWGDSTNLDTIRAAARLLERRLKRDFGAGAMLWGTAAQTGLDCLERSLPTRKGDDGASHGYHYAPPPPEVAAIIRRWSGQHRRELLTLPELESIPGFAVVDARLAYAGCVREVPCFFSGWDDLPDYEPHRQAWYRISARVPAGWAHIGLIPVPSEDGERWEWPAAPGTRIEDVWVHGLLLGFAINQGWPLAIHERILFAAPGTPGADPLRRWQEKLVGAYEDAGKPETGELGPLLRGAIRHMLLDAIGSFHRQYVSETQIVPYAAGVPTEGTPPRPTANGWEYQTRRELPAERRQWMQPQWSGAIWQRQRYRLTYRAFGRPRASLLATRTDALILDGVPPWATSEISPVGSFRLKGHYLPGPLPAPHDARELAALLRETEREEVPDGTPTPL